uniref:Uncharacterized protein n=1 Tax=uncultured Parcubacteria bacterium Rifle_16ft_4_minimus_2958 TaxID=1665137 RepID=A0A0H4T2L8_9BACT|nr:hypothetical protein [uncultured Parcubacteria bacterium Rifle_16ft_4_minimus_2958]
MIAKILNKKTINPAEKKLDKLVEKGMKKAVTQYKRVFERLAEYDKV